MGFVVVIPARYASTRLPAKPLADIAGKPMIQWVCEQAQASGADRVVVATDDQRVYDAVKGFGAEVVMTSAHHHSGTERLAEVVELLGLSEEQVVVNVQGDEPLIPPANIRQVAENLVTSGLPMATLGVAIEDAEEMFNPNAVKVVCGADGRALYFSRAPIPYHRDGFAHGPAVSPGALRHVGIYGYRAGFIRRYVGWPASPLEAIESLEQLRVLYYGEGIHVEEAKQTPPAGVDTPEDLERVRRTLCH
ncbi:3-deoxy-manno-octulosonate cytidylyltransferase [Ferrimonas sediminicola]|uniref:3-deoxy-manno-octulosonate cytidylyltransferase n=1 Tax=Ferrimonas sediminicola TaxID=2569538 RepID=A0A4U1BGE4_9GAMM|nr:3-deoxy-manno-octulosonate cytidylyltransferase [Ferrimonas sediminicola]TKB49081.1 3-deoxy-manno-octulosonate cytidylyltransferase [Ferrimonas sediminicola]